MKKVVIVILVLVSAYMLLSKFIPKKGIEKKEMAPDIITKLVNGSEFQLSDLQGNYVFLDFWGSWCGPCLGEASNVVALNNKYDGVTFKDGMGFKTVSVALERNDRNWSKVAERLGFNWKHQIVDISRIVATSDIGSMYGIRDIPSKFLIGPDGQFILVKTSLSEIDNFLSDKL